MNITGTSGNDLLQNPGGGSLSFVLAATSAENGIWPNINILVNGVTVQANVTVTANNATGATQTVTVTAPAGTTSFAIQYTNDTQTDWTTGDRNVFIKSITLNGVSISPTIATYDRTQNGAYFDTVPGQADMVWGGQMTFSGTTVQSAAAAGGVTSDTIDGLAGFDILQYGGARAEYSITESSAGHWTITHGSEVDSVTNVERLQFADMHHAIDMQGSAGTVAKLIATLWGESYLSAKDFVTVGLRLADQGSTPTQLAAMAVGTAEFQARAGSSSNADFVKTVAANLGYTGDTSGYLNQLNSGATTKADLAVMASEYMTATMSSTNHVTLMGVMHGGIDYL